MVAKRFKLSSTGFILCLLLELIGLAATGAGIGMEVALKADWCFVVITGGGLLMGLGGIIFGKVLKTMH